MCSTTKNCFNSIILYDVAMASKIIFIVIAVVVTIMVSVVIAASLGTQDDVYEAADPQPTHATSETLDTVNGTSDILAEPQDSVSKTSDTVNGTSDTLAEPQDSVSKTSDTVNGTSDTLAEPQDSTSQATEPPTQSEEFGRVDIAVGRGMTKSNLPKVVDAGLMNPAIGELTGKRVDDIMARLGLADFNSYLEEIGAPWRMNFVEESTAGDPIITLYKIQSLNSKDINLVLGPISNAEVRHIKSYVDSNDMVLISSTSTSSSLAGR